MPITRLENFLRSPKGTVLYVDPNNFDATDSFENRGDSATRPFKSIQRALIESARFSFQIGFNNDLNDRTTILVSSGTHYIDNRPGYSITNESGAVYRKRTGKDNWTIDALNEFTEESNFDIFDPNNDLYKFNSVEGGVILPRGTSIVGLDLRKTKIRPLYVPDPYNDDVERSSIFKVTGNCYFTAFTFFDSDPSVGSYKDYTDDIVVAKFSHHKLTTFTYADGVNKVKLGSSQTNLTDLQMYYYKIANAYGNTSGREIPNYPSSIDIEPIIDEFRIVGVLEENLIGISSIRSGNGTGGGILNEITVTTKDLTTNLQTPHNLTEGTPILISGISINPTSYNGSFVVNSVVGPNTFTYITPSIPSTKLPTSNQISNAIIKVESDSTSSSSPYIFNCSLRSSYGMCGLWADGNKSDGFKSIVVAQFTGISLQKDDNAFLLYSKSTLNYLKNNQLDPNSTERPLHTNSFAIYDPKYENFHIRASNGSFIQCVSIFAIGFAKHFLTETGGDMSITNSNSNFGAVSLESYGFRNESFDRDNNGYITHIIPPKDIPLNEVEVNWLAIDVEKTRTSIANTQFDRKYLYIYGYDDVDNPPPFKANNYTIGARDNDKLYLNLDGEVYESVIFMSTHNPDFTQRKTSKKEHQIILDSSTPITGVIGIATHTITNGETVRVFSDTGEMPDGLESNKLYHLIRYGDGQIQLASSYDDAINGVPILGITNSGGNLTLVSSVIEKIPGEPGHPIQWDESESNWYIISNKVNSEYQTANQIYRKIETDLTLTGNTPETTFKRVIDTRTSEDRLYKVRYVIPKEYLNAREPSIGFVLQETKTVGVSTGSITSNSNLSIFDRKNERIIKNITAGSVSNNSQIVTVETENSHHLLVGDTVLIENVKSTFNPNATGITSSFNGSYEVLSVTNSRTFTYRISGVSINPGVFTNDTKTRNSSTISSLPTVKREKYKNTFIIYRVDIIKPHIPGPKGQDGIYHLTLITSNVKTRSNVGYGLSTITYNQDIRNLYPQIDRDNYIPNPDSAVSYADHLTPGRVLTNNKKNSLTRETLNYFIHNNSIGFGINNVSISGAENNIITITTDVEHKLNSIKRITLTNGGSGQSGSYYGAPIRIDGNPTDAVCNYSTSSGSIISSTIEFIDAGSSFNVNDIIDIGDFGAKATVLEINSSISDGLELGGFHQNEFNNVFKILSIPDSTTIVLQSPYSLPSYIENPNGTTPFGFISSKGIIINSIQFSDITTGIVTVTTSQSHGLQPGNNFTIVESNQSQYNSEFTVNKVLNLTQFNFNIGIATTTSSANTGRLFKKLIQPNAKSTGVSGENLQGRLNYIFAGISTVITTSIPLEGTTLVLPNENTGLKRGDFIQANGEVIRLVQKTSSTQYNIQRGVFGTIKKEVPTNTRIYKINVIPVESRRPSFIRASGHTFEYVGYGPGNYSTAIPQKQNRKLTEEEILISQSKKISGGTVVYTGMNDIGEYYNGSTKLNAITGQESTVDAPLISFVGGDVDGTDTPNNSSGQFDNLLVQKTLTVEGGSTFNGTVNFQNSVQFNNDFSLKTLRLGSQNSKLFTVIDKPTLPNYGDITYSNTTANYVGEIYSKNNVTNSNEWRRWGIISKSPTEWDIEVDKIKASSIDADAITINGKLFSDVGAGDALNLSSLKVTNLEVSGITTFKGVIFGDDNDDIKFRNKLLMQNAGAISAGYSGAILGDGRTIYLGITTGRSYSLAINYAGINTNADSRILHRGNGTLSLLSEDPEGSVELSNIGIGASKSTLSMLSKSQGGIVQISRSISSAGSNGAHLSILNENKNGDSVISWRSGIGVDSRQFWFAGVNNNQSSGSNIFTIACSNLSTTNITAETFSNAKTKIGISTLGKIELYSTKEVAVHSGILTFRPANSTTGIATIHAAFRYPLKLKNQFTDDGTLDNASGLDIRALMPTGKYTGTRYEYNGVEDVIIRLKQPAGISSTSTNTLGDDIGGHTHALIDHCVTTDKIAPDAVTSPKIEPGAVITPKIKDGAVTPEKLSGGQIGTGAIVDNGSILEFAPIYGIRAWGRISSNGTVFNGANIYQGNGKTFTVRHTGVNNEVITYSNMKTGKLPRTPVSADSTGLYQIVFEKPMAKDNFLVICSLENDPYWVHPNNSPLQIYTLRNNTADYNTSGKSSSNRNTSNYHFTVVVRRLESLIGGNVAGEPWAFNFIVISQ